MFEKVQLCPVMRGVPLNELEILFKSMHFNIHQYDTNQMVIESGADCNSLMILIEGEVRGEMPDQAGKTVKIEDIAAPRPIAPAFLFGQNNKCPVNVIANIPTRVLFIPRNEFLKLLQQNTTILTNYLNIISSRSQFLSGKIKFLSFKTLREKIAQYIYELSGENLKTIFTGKSQEELAEFFGVARPSLSRTLKEMENEGILKTERKYITILDREKLSRLIS
ncbi:MAG: hypothetical protein A2W91_12425 [Bacteroidetes bacterium GWF2_38_335]|nr:MAG: hypothetical protein A2W91_12425 [Bacteroidetes bacterium GWF2_38_335]OFY76974.1 MAG: hypothetical protein A2281_00540 [Bacteroidetes bacterium RIFOXYA12_FULL_38_20]HBS86829.1 Crp/Fnr family transcriptional regulator [Bacteroidales bacterium]